MELRWKPSPRNKLKIERILWFIDEQNLQNIRYGIKLKGNNKWGRNLRIVQQIYEIRAYRRERIATVHKLRKTQKILWGLSVTHYPS